MKNFETGHSTPTANNLSAIQSALEHGGVEFISEEQGGPGLDSVEYQKDNKGGKIRAALRERTTSKTIPQIFIGGQYIGGATELFDAAKDGSMQKLLEENTVNYNKKVQDDPYSFLPGWLHKR